MAYISTPKFKQTRWYLKPICLFQKIKYKRILEPSLIWSIIPRSFLDFLSLHSRLNRKKSPLEKSLRALVMLRVSQIEECPFCIDIHSYFLLKQAQGVEKIKALPHFNVSALLSDREKLALAYTDKVCKTPPNVDQTFIDHLKQHFSEQEIVELTALIGAQLLSAKFNSSLGISSAKFCSSPSSST